MNEWKRRNKRNTQSERKNVWEKIWNGNNLKILKYLIIAKKKVMIYKRWKDQICVGFSFDSWKDCFGKEEMAINYKVLETIEKKNT